MSAPNPTPANRNPPRVGAIGDKLGGRYTLNRPLARGGMAEVWEAHDTILDRRVAAKILYTHLAIDPGFVARFRREAVSAARLNHPAIVTVFDTGVDVDPRTSGQRAYIIMELIPGKTLRSLLTEGAVSIEEAVDIMAQAAEGLSYAHVQGVVHRDVKPGNIMVQPDGRVKVADFGIAKAIQDVGPDTDDLTQAGAILGTAKYLSPEQVDGTAVDARSDIYSLGVVLYEASVGQPPFVGSTDLATAMLHVNGTTQRPRQVRPEIPRNLESIIIKAMSRDPAERFQRASEMARALRSDEPLRTSRQVPMPIRSFDEYDDAIPLVTRNAEDETPSQWANRGKTGGETTTLIDDERTTIDTRKRSGNATDQSKPHTLRGTEPSVGNRREARPRAGRSRASLLAALAIIGLAIGGTMGWSFGAPTATLIPVKSVQIFDPPPGEGTENSRIAPRLIDGTIAAWVTERYGQGFSGLAVPKRGVGVIIELPNLIAVDSIQIESLTNGWDAEVYATDFPGDDLNSWGPKIVRSESIAIGTERISINRRTRRVLLWISDLGSGNTTVSISEIRMYG
jgi:serine/threonine protein kinase